MRRRGRVLRLRPGERVASLDPEKLRRLPMAKLIQLRYELDEHYRDRERTLDPEIQRSNRRELLRSAPDYYSNPWTLPMAYYGYSGRSMTHVHVRANRWKRDIACLWFGAVIGILGDWYFLGAPSHFFFFW